MTGSNRLVFLLLILASCVLMPRTNAHSTQLDILYIDYPPYFENGQDGNPHGIFVDIADRIFQRAGVSYKFSLIPPKRILQEMQNGKPVISIGWLKTAEREKFARFSMPVFRNKPVGVFFLREKLRDFADFNSFRELMETERFKIGRINGHSEGDYLDSVLMQHDDQSIWVATDEVQMIKLLKIGRFDFLLLPPEETEVLVKKANYDINDFVLQTMDDMPPGNTRHIMYSRSVDESLIEKIDRIIAKEIGNL